MWWDFLIHTSDTFHRDEAGVLYDEDYDRKSCMKQAYIQRAVPTGHEWGKLEKDPKRFLVVRDWMPEFNPEWLLPELDDDKKDKSDRIWRFPLAKILTPSELEALNNIPYNEQPFRPQIIKNVSLEEIAEYNDWTKKPKKIKLHGSAGDFDIIENGSGDYTSLKTAVETEAANISGGSVDANFFISGVWNSSDTGNWDIDGWTMGSNNMLIQTSGDSRNADGTYNDSGTRYRIENGTAEIFDIEIDNVNVDGINGIGYILTSAGSNWTLENINLDTTATNGFWFFTGSGAVKNCVVTGGSGRGLLYASVGTLTFTNNTIYDKDIGVRVEATGATINALNSALFNNTNDFFTQSGTLNIDYCATEEGAGEGTNGVAITQTGGTPIYEDLVTDAPNHDFSLKDIGSQLYDSGTATGMPTTDIRGETRVTNDIGAFALADSGGLTEDVDGLLPAMSGELTRKVSFHRLIEGVI